MRKVKTLLVTAVLTAAFSMTAYAGTWQQNQNEWKYQNDDGAYSANVWQWIDGNNDGIAECYYFDANGNLFVNGVTPDGNTVDINGAWAVNGIVQVQSFAAVQAQETQANVPTQSSGISSSPYDGYTIVANTSTKKYHVPSCNSVAKMTAENTGYCSDAAYLDAQGYSACKLCH